MHLWKMNIFCSMEMRQILTDLTQWIERYEELERNCNSLSGDLLHMRQERDNLRELVVELKQSKTQVSEPTMIANLELLKNYDRRVKELTTQLSVYQTRKVSESPHTSRRSVVNQCTQTDELSVAVDTVNTTIPPHVPPRISLEDLGDDFMEAVLREINGVHYTVFDQEPHYIFLVSKDEELGACVGYYYQDKPFFYDSL